MTRKDYEKFAEMIRYNKANPGIVNADAENGYQIALMDMAQHMADIFRADNPRFDRGRFLKACGIES
jgi:hypothetical protein